MTVSTGGFEGPLITLVILVIQPRTKDRFHEDGGGLGSQLGPRRSTMHRRRYLPALGGLAVLALVLSGFFANGAIAQSPEATMGAQGGETAHPAHIHSGTCDQLGDVVYPLNDLTAPNAAGTPTAGSQGAMSEASPAAGMTSTSGGQVVAESTTVVTTTLDELLGAPHAINVHESAENIGNYIACGEITAAGEAAGTPATGGRQIEVPLQELNNSGYAGHATLVEMGDGTIQVTVQLIQAVGGGMATGSPMASPTS